MNKPLKIALSKGRVADAAMTVLIESGIQFDDTWKRALILSATNEALQVILAKAVDIPTLVEKGAVDLGIVGSDVLDEAESKLFELLSLPIGRCTLCIAGPADQQDAYWRQGILRIATKYPQLAKKYLDQENLRGEIIQLNGSVELGPLIGLSDVILDIVETGKTLVDNGLVVYEKIGPVNAKLVCNRAVFKTRYDRIEQFVETFRGRNKDEAC